MGIVLSLALYFIIWWTVLFAVLPFGVRTQGEAGHVVPGTPESAPEKPALLRIVVLTTLIAAIVFGIVWLEVTYRIVGVLDYVPRAGEPARR